MTPVSSPRDPRPVRLISATAGLALVALLAACAAPEGGGDDAMADGDGTAMSAEAGTVCWLRGETTAAEAMERASPFAEVEMEIGDETATFCYHRPSARDREVLGNLIPLGSIWRLGANEAAQLHLPFDAEVGGQAVDAGVYSIYSMAGEEEWEFFLNSNYQRWGIPVDASVRATEVASFTRPVAETDGMVETFTATWEEHGEGMGHLVLEWENTRVEVPIHHAGMEMGGEEMGG